jgi:hypothetical protein
MNHPREPFERLLDVFDEPFKRAAARHGFVFDARAGHVGRALRLADDPLKRGVFLDFKSHWMESDATDPELVLQTGAWTATHVLFERFFEGRRSALTARADNVLERALTELRAVTVERIDREGKALAEFSKGPPP